VAMVPSYAPLHECVRGSGRVLVVHSLRRAGGTGAYEMDIHGLALTLERSHARVCLLINPHNPCGRVWRRDELAALARVCAERGVIVVAGPQQRLALIIRT